MMRFKSIVLRAITLLSDLFSGCTNKKGHIPAPVSTVIGIDNFTFKTYSLLSKESGNLFFSPFSISTALSMAAEGAGGETLKEMRNILGLSNNSSANRKYFESLLKSLNDMNAGCNLSIANAIWIEKTFPVRKEFSNVLSTYYLAMAQEVDFSSNPDGERMNINNWVAGKTNNKILDLVPPGGLDNLTILVIVNAIYFKGNWAQQFNKSDTENAPFFISPSEYVNVRMMHISRSKNASYYSDDELKALEMDYQGDHLSMLILLPNPDHTISEVEFWLSSTKISDIRAKLIRMPVQIWLPRFSFTGSKEMSDLLKELGMKRAFNQFKADFSRINPTGWLFISFVFHKAFINVDETGTEAAAATAVIVTRSAPEITPEFRADHPFLFFIMHKHTGAILFMGRLVDPMSVN